jgi:hypothetical protein
MIGLWAFAIFWGPPDMGAFSGINKAPGVYCSRPTLAALVRDTFSRRNGLRFPLLALILLLICTKWRQP